MMAQFLLSPVCPPRPPQYLRRLESMYLISQVESVTNRTIILFAEYMREREILFNRNFMNHGREFEIVHKTFV